MPTISIFIQDKDFIKLVKLTEINLILKDLDESLLSAIIKTLGIITVQIDANEEHSLKRVSLKYNKINTIEDSIPLEDLDTEKIFLTIENQHLIDFLATAGFDKESDKKVCEQLGDLLINININLKKRKIKNKVRFRPR